MSITPIKANSVLDRIFLTSIVISLGFNFVVLDGNPPIYFGHIVMFILGAVILFTLVAMAAIGNKRLHYNFNVFFIFVTLAVYASLGYLTDNPRFTSEVGKFIFFLFITYSLLTGFSNYNFTVKFAPFGVVMGVIISSTYYIVSYDIVSASVDNRLDASSLGGYNSFGFLVANGILCLFYFITIDHRKLHKIIISIAIGYLFIVLLSTFSRNAMITMIVGVIVYIGGFLGLRKLIFVLGITLISLVGLYASADNVRDIFINRFIFSEDLFSGNGTGRTEIWGTLISDLLRAPFNLLFGFGFGGISTEVTGGSTTVNSAHNQFLELWHAIGLIALSGVLASVAKLFIDLRRLQISPEKCLLSAVLAQITLTLFFDSHLQSSQIGWIFALWLSVIIYFSRNVKIGEASIDMK